MKSDELHVYNWKLHLYWKFWNTSLPYFMLCLFQKTRWSFVVTCKWSNDVASGINSHLADEFSLYILNFLKKYILKYFMDMYMFNYVNK